MLGLLKSLTDVATDVVKTIAAPAEIAVDLTRAVTKPIADTADELVKEVKKATK